MTDPRAALNRTRWPWSVAGVIACTAGLTALGIWLTDFDPRILAGLALVVFTALEFGVQRSGARRRATAKALIASLIDRVDQPTAGWMRGLPFLRGLVDGRAFALTFESTGERLRAGLTVAALVKTPVFLASVLPEDHPEKLIMTLMTRRAYVVFDADGPDLRALALQPDVASEYYDVDAMRPILTANAPYTTTLDAGFETVRWDTLLTDRVDADRILELVATLPPLFQVREEDEEDASDVAEAPG